MSDGTHRPGHFVWFELFTDDAGASESFYEGLFGWRAVTSCNGHHHYRMMTSAGEPVGGVITLTTRATQSVDPQWLPYVSVPDVDEAVVSATHNRGVLLAQARNVGGLGRFAVVADPNGAELAVWRSSRGDPPAPAQPKNSTFCWTEVHAPDPDGAAHFYRKLLTWNRQNPGDSEENWVFARGATQAASLVRQARASTSSWLCHLLVPDLDRARERAIELGGELEIEEIPAPGFGRYAIIRDNVGAKLSLFTPN